MNKYFKQQPTKKMNCCRLNLNESELRSLLQFNFRVKVLECSAKDDTNVTDLFRTIVSLSRVLHIDGADSTSGLKRRSSAYVSATSKGQFIENPQIFQTFFIGTRYYLYGMIMTCHFS